MTDNMKIWDAVSKTDPKHTKPVSFGRKFTAIDAQWQIMQATKQFGPAGKGWWYNVEYSVQDAAWSRQEDTKREDEAKDYVLFQFADVTLWWSDGEEIYRFGPVRGCNMLVNQKGHIDEDAPKKAMTDALTKALSHLGFSADVFLGLFDDNKYVQQRQKESQEDTKREDDAAWSRKVIARLESAKTLTELAEMIGKLEPHLDGREPDMVATIRTNISLIERKLEKGEK